MANVDASLDPVDKPDRQTFGQVAMACKRSVSSPSTYRNQTILLYDCNQLRHLLEVYVEEIMIDWQPIGCVGWRMLSS